jgi:MFS family permease
VLTEKERGTVSGFMMAGMYTGIAIGGAGVLYVSDILGRLGVPIVYSFLVPVICIMLVTLLVSLRLGEGAHRARRAPMLTRSCPPPSLSPRPRPAVCSSAVTTVSARASKAAACARA